MKKTLFVFLMIMSILVCSISFAASYTLPEKLEKQITYGSGISGSFEITADGDIADTPFFKAVSDAEFSIRGLVSGKDYLFSVFQADQSEKQTVCMELYKDEITYYLRSDMVQGKVLSFPDRTSIIESLFRQKGDNPSPASFIAELTNLNDTNGKNTLDSILSRYRYELELWLSRYVTDGVFVRLDDGQSAFDSSYDIPIDDFKDLIIKLMGELTADTEVSDFLDTIMTPEQKAVYMNKNLLYFYKEALDAIMLEQNVHINRRATTLGAVISTDLTLPLDSKVTGYYTMNIHNENNQNVFSLLGDRQVFVVSLPDKGQNSQNTNEENTYVVTRIDLDRAESKDCNFSAKVIIQKASETRDDEEGRSHQNDRYKIYIQPDDTYVPDSFDKSLLSPFEAIEADLEMHYSSKFAQNSSTKLEFKANIKKEKSDITVQGSLKTVNSDSWVFRPFDTSHTDDIGTDSIDKVVSYLTDWVSNASSMIHHNLSNNDEPETINDSVSETDVKDKTDPEETDQTDNAETMPLPDE